MFRIIWNPEIFGETVVPCPVDWSVALCAFKNNMQLCSKTMIQLSYSEGFLYARMQGTRGSVWLGKDWDGEPLASFEVEMMKPLLN